MKTALRFLTASLAASLLLISTGCSNQDDSSNEATGHITRAETYADQGQYRSAMLEVRNALQKDPGNIDHVLVLAEIYNTIGASQLAIDLLEPWKNDYSERVALPLAKAYTERGKHLSARETLSDYEPESEADKLTKQILLAEGKRIGGNTSEAINELRRLNDANPGNEEIIAAWAKALLTANEPSAALTTLNNWSRDQAEPSADILYLTGLAHYRLGQIEESTEKLTQATGAVPSSDVFLPVRQSILTLLSRSLTEQGRITEAQVYNKILAENTNSDARERAESALAAINQGDLESARTALEDLVQQNPDNEQVAMMLGALNLQEGRTDEALSLLVENVDAETTPTPFIRAATMAQLDSGKREDALATLSRAIEARPDDAELLAMHGLLALSLPARAQEGIASLSKALDLEPSRSRLRVAMARHYESQDQIEQALGQMRVAFTETPTDWAVTRYYISLLLGNDQMSEAAEVKDSLLNGFADEPTAITLAAMTEYRLGEVDQARARLEKQLEQQPDNVPTLIALASVYRDQDNRDQAVATLLKVAELTPDRITPLREAVRTYAQNRSAEDAVEWLDDVADRNPSLAPNSHAMIAQIRIRQGQLEQAEAALEAIPEEQRSDVARAATGQLRVAQAELAVRAEDWTTARARAAEAAAIMPGNLRFALVPVEVLAAEGKHQQALNSLQELEASLGENTATILAHTRLTSSIDGPGAAWEYLDGRWQATSNAELLPFMVSLAKQASPDSLDRVTQAWVDATPGSSAAQMSRAEYDMSQGNNSAAISRYQAELEQNPDNPIALNNLAWLLRKQDQAKALSLAARAEELAPQNPAILDTHGWLLHLAGRSEEAKPKIERAMELAPGSEEIRNHLEQVMQSL